MGCDAVKPMIRHKLANDGGGQYPSSSWSWWYRFTGSHKKHRRMRRVCTVEKALESVTCLEANGLTSQAIWFFRVSHDYGVDGGFRYIFRCVGGWFWDELAVLRIPCSWELLAFFHNARRLGEEVFLFLVLPMSDLCLQVSVGSMSFALFNWLFSEYTDNGVAN